MAAHRWLAEQCRKLGVVDQPVGIPAGPIRVVTIDDPVDDVVCLCCFVQ